MEGMKGQSTFYNKVKYLSNRYDRLISYFILFGFTFFSYLYLEMETNEYVKNGKYTFGRTTGRSGSYIEYEYTVNEIRYTGRGKPYFNPIYREVGGHFYVAYLKNNPNEHRILFDKHVENIYKTESDSIVAEDLSLWRVLGFRRIYDEFR